MDDSGGPFELGKGNLRHGGGRTAPPPPKYMTGVQPSRKTTSEVCSSAQRICRGGGGASRGEVASCEIGSASAPLRRNSLPLRPQQRRPARCNRGSNTSAPPGYSNCRTPFHRTSAAAAAPGAHVVERDARRRGLVDRVVVLQDLQRHPNTVFL